MTRLAPFWLALGIALAASVGLWLIPLGGLGPRLVVVTATPTATSYPTWPVATALPPSMPTRPLTATPTVPFCGEGGYVTRNGVRVCRNRPPATAAPTTPMTVPPTSARLDRMEGR